MLFVAILYWFEADKIRISPLDGPVTAAGLPKALAVALGVLAIIMILLGAAATLRGKHREIQPEVRAKAVPAARSHPHIRALGMLALGLAYLVLVPILGYAFTIALLLLSVSLYIGARLSGRIILIALIGGVLFHLLFVEFLDIPQPAGLLLAALIGPAG